MVICKWEISNAVLKDFFPLMGFCTLSLEKPKIKERFYIIDLTSCTAVIMFVL